MNTLEALSKKYDGIETGYVYVMQFRFRTRDSYKTLYKVGVTKNKPIDRMLEICRSFFQVRRYVPECKLVRFRKVPEYYRLEKEVHNRLDRYQFNISFSGSTEFVDIELDNLLGIYDEVVPLCSKDIKIEAKLPKWAYSDKELEEISNKSIDENIDYYIYR